MQGGNDQGTSITVEFREFGVRLNFLPVVLGDGRIRLKLNPEVSDVDFTNAVVEARRLLPVAAVRLGLPATRSLPPLVDWPDRLRAAIVARRDRR